MQIIQELKQGTPRFQVKEDGSETVEYKPPTSKELRAARALEALIAQLEGLNRANQTLVQQLQQAEFAIRSFSQQVAELRENAEKLKSTTENKNTENIDSKNSS